MLTISGKALGRKKPLFADWSVSAPAACGGADTVTLQQLIDHVVREEVAAFRERQEERRLIRALTAADVAKGVVGGKIDSGGRDKVQKVDAEEAVANALQAFADGIYLVVVDGAEQRQLDAALRLQPDSRIAFVRLAMLAGG